MKRDRAEEEETVNKIFEGKKFFVPWQLQKMLRETIKKHGGETISAPATNEAADYACFAERDKLRDQYMQRMLASHLEKGCKQVRVDFVFDCVLEGKILTDNVEEGTVSHLIGKRHEIPQNDEAKRRKVEMENSGTDKEEVLRNYFPKPSVIRENGDVISVLFKSENDFHLLQAYHDEIAEKYFVFSRFGQLGQFGTMDVQIEKTKEDTLATFYNRFKEISGGSTFEDYLNDKYEQKNAFMPVEKPKPHPKYVPYSAMKGGPVAQSEKIEDFTHLPDEVILHAFSYSDLSTLGALSISYRRFDQLLSSNDFWIDYHNKFITSQPLKLYGKTYEEKHYPFGVKPTKKKKMSDEDGEDDGDDEEEEKEEEEEEEEQDKSRPPTDIELFRDASLKKAKSNAMLISTDKLKLINEQTQRAFEVSGHKDRYQTISAKEFFRRKYVNHKYLAHLYKFVRFESTYDDELDIVEALTTALEKKPLLEEIVIGAYDECCDSAPTDIMDWFLANAGKLSNLTSIFYGDVHYSHAMISGIEIGNVTPLLDAFPQLLHFKTLGIAEFQPVSHTNLMSFAWVCGGMSAVQLENVLKMDLPNLIHLELWLGTHDYGSDLEPEHFEELLSTEENGMFPSLQYLGLRNCDIINKLMPMITKSAIAKRIRILDISNGTLSEEGAKHIQELKSLPLLEVVVGYHHFLKKETTKQFVEMDGDFNFAIDLTEERYDGDDDYRFVCVGE